MIWFGWVLWDIKHYHHHHHLTPSAWISPNPFPHSSLSSFASGRLKIQATSCICTEPLYLGSIWLTCLWSSMWKGSTGVCHMSSSLLLQQCPACLVRLTWIVFVMGGNWPYSYCFLGRCLQDLINIARSILVYLS